LVRVINPFIFGGATSGFLLDDYPGAVAAYSIDALSSSTTNVVRLVRGGDLAERDFTATELTDGTLATWADGEDASINTWYDQSGSGNHLMQTSTPFRPRLAVGGVAVSEGALFISNDYMYVSTELFSSSFSVFGVGQNQSSNSVAGFWENEYPGDTGNRTIAFLDTRSSPKRHSGYLPDGTARFVDVLSANSVSTQYLHTTIADGSTMYGFRNAVSQGSVGIVSSSGANKFTIGRQLAGSLYLTGKIAEVIVYAADKTSDRAGIEANINTRHSIY
jgi:hypothetical protein